MHQFRSEGPAYILVGLLRSWRAVELGLVALLHQRAARQACTLTKVQLFSEIIQGTLIIFPKGSSELQTRNADISFLGLMVSCTSARLDRLALSQCFRDGAALSNYFGFTFSLIKVIFI